MVTCLLATFCLHCLVASVISYDMSIHFLFQPFCDGAHKTKAPSIAPLRFTPEKSKAVMLCACKETKNPPYCDGSHFKVIFQDIKKSVKGLFKS